MKHGWSQTPSGVWRYGDLRVIPTRPIHERRQPGSWSYSRDGGQTWEIADTREEAMQRAQEVTDADS